MPSQITVIDPAVRVAELDCFNHLSRMSPIPLTYHLPAMMGLDSLRADSGTIAGIIVLGSASSVYDGKPWQKPLADWLLAQLERKIPTLGLCYGHQLLAHLYGARIGFARPDKRKLSGWRKIQLEATPLTGGSAREGKLLVSHREVVQECPKAMQVTGKSAEVEIEALAHRTLPIWTYQAHPEATPVFLQNCGIPPAPNMGMFAFGHELVRAFLEQVAKGTGR